MVVQHNMQAMNSSRMLNITTGQQAKSTEKLSSGYRINRAADDAAGLSISEKMRKQIRGLDQASTNASDGVSAVQTAEGALQEVHSMLQRMNELAVQAANGTNSETDRSSIQDEINQLTTEIDRVAETTKFNESYLLKGGKDTQINTLKGHDAGIKGNFVDGSDTATLKVDLSVGTSIKIGGQDYNIVSGTDADNDVDSLKKIQTDIKNIANAGAQVSVNGTLYTAEVAGPDLKFDAGTGTTYSADELAGMVKDGTTVSISGAKDSGGTAIANSTDVIARDYLNSKTNITAADATTKIEQALNQANNIGTTKTKASVSSSASTPTAASVATLANNPASTAKVKTGVSLIAVKGDEVVNLAAGEDLKDYANGYTLYKAGDATLDAGKNNTKDILIEHTTETERKGVKAYAAGAATGGTTDGLTATGAADTGYAVYEKVDSIESVADITGATKAGSIEYASTAALKITMEPLPGDATKTADTKTMVDGQNALIDNLAKINFTYTDTTGGGKFSHTGLTDDKLDVRENGEVYYDSKKIATLASALTTGTTAGDSVAASANATTAKGAYVENPSTAAGSNVTFTITKGQTEVANSFSLNLHVGADADMTNKISIGVNSMTSEALGIQGINVSDDSGMSATYAIDAIEDAIKTVSEQRSALGAVQNRLEHTIANVDNVVENSTAAESRIRDTDMADEMVKFSKNNILAQAGQSMLAQANQSTQGVLSILG